MNDLLRVLSIGGMLLLLGFVWHMIAYTRDEFWIIIFVWITTFVLSAILSVLVSSQTLIKDMGWYLYVAGGVVVICYGGLRSRWPYPRIKADQLWEIVKTFYNEGDSKQAWRAARQLMAKESRAWGVRHILGCICNQRGQYRRALWHLTFANELEPDHVETLHELGYAYLMKKKYNKAKAVLEQARQIDFDNQIVVGLLEECQREMLALNK